MDTMAMDVVMADIGPWLNGAISIGLLAASAVTMTAMWEGRKKVTWALIYLFGLSTTGFLSSLCVLIGHIPGLWTASASAETQRRCDRTNGIGGSFYIAANVFLYHFFLQRVMIVMDMSSHRWALAFMRWSLNCFWLVFIPLCAWLVGGHVQHVVGLCVLRVPAWLSLVFLAFDVLISIVFISMFVAALQNHQALMKTSAKGKTSGEQRQNTVLLSVAARNLRWSLVCIVTTTLNQAYIMMVSWRGWPAALQGTLVSLDMAANVMAMFMCSHLWMPSFLINRFSNTHHSIPVRVPGYEHRGSAVVSPICSLHVLPPEAAAESIESFRRRDPDSVITNKTSEYLRDQESETRLLINRNAAISDQDWSTTSPPPPLIVTKIEVDMSVHEP